MAFQQGLTFFTMPMTSVPERNMTEVMRTFVKSKECKRKIILNYFGHNASNVEQDHSCCDFHSQQCQCDDCELARAVDGVEALTPHEGTTGAEKIENKKTFPISSETKSNIRKDLVHNRMQLQKNIGRSAVGSVALSSGFYIELT